MRIEHVGVRDTGTAATVRRNTTSGIASGYQRTNVTTSGATLVESTDMMFSITVVGLPWPELVSYGELEDMKVSSLPELTEDEIAAMGYMELSEENKRLAEELFPIDAKTWPEWECN